MIGSHRDQAHFDRARWRKRVLLPCWIIQIPILLTLMGIFSYRLSNTVNTYKEEKQKGNVPMVEFVWECANISFSTVSFIINAVQIAKFIAEALTPFSMLFGNVVSLVLSTAILALDVVVYVRHSEKNYSTIALALDCALLFFNIVAIIYGVIIYRRLAAYDEYHHPHNVKHFGFAEDQDTAYDPARMSLNAQPETLYDPTDVSDSRPRRPSFTFRRSLSSASRGEPVSPGPQPDAERPVSYDHKRDTQFDEYIASQRSSLNSNHGADGALGVLPSRDGTRRDSLSPQSSLTRPRAGSGPRPLSWEVNMGTDTRPDGIQRGHSLISVPEAHEPEEDIGDARLNKSRPVSEDRAGLLGNRTVSGYSVASYTTRDSRVEPFQPQEAELESHKRRRDS
ncbi:hypothetical protein JX266_003375 [Neoarthrinium moseri]|nr:hypothetical protein JX266_003375 [Neoarthrinium moseri]